MVNYRFLSAIFLLFFASSCHVPTKVAMGEEGGRTAYNKTLQETTNEQMLLNIVRLRYVDFPFFLDVNNITTQYTYGSKAGAQIPIPGFTKKNPAEIEGEVIFQDRPTISYTPLEGNVFSERLFSPVDLQILQQLIYGGWDINRVLRICVQSLDKIPNAPTASTPVWDFGEPQFQEFLELTRLLRYFQARSELGVGVKYEQKGETMKSTSMQFSFPISSKESDNLKNLLTGVEEANDRYVYTAPLGFNKRSLIGIMPRSLMASMYFLSAGVKIPRVHEFFCKRINGNQDDDDEDFDWSRIIKDLFTVKFCKRKPVDAYVAVKYKGFWFYIADCDVETKRTFVLLLQLYNLQSSSVSTGAPILTIPLF